MTQPFQKDLPLTDQVAPDPGINAATSTDSVACKSQSGVLSVMGSFLLMTDDMSIMLRP